MGDFDDVYLPFAIVAFVAAVVIFLITWWRSRRAAGSPPFQPDLRLLEAASLNQLRLRAADVALAEFDFAGRNWSYVRGLGWLPTGDRTLAQILVVKASESEGTAVRRITMVVEFEHGLARMKESRIEADFAVAPSA